MHLLLGDPTDSWCASVRGGLEARGYETHLTANPFEHPYHFAWRLDNHQSKSRLVLDGLSLEPLESVFVRRTGWIDPTGWRPDDLNYVQAETQAALLAWLWGLECPVVNRYPAAIWYRPQLPLLSWQSLLRGCGLPVLEQVITSVAVEARAFGERLSSEGVAGAVYAPLTTDTRYLLTEEHDWEALAAIQGCAPVCLTYPHGPVQFACVVGERVIWQGAATSEMVKLAPLLRRFANAAQLAFVELALGATSRGIGVIAIETHPNYDHFGETARRDIVEALVHLLAPPTDWTRQHASSALEFSGAG
ncbi:MAG TPA: hypothetical protein VEX68_16155, partial [Bryobacteraceae bacterium]|nr:hypothetical protein [Bryobacteraceae bacterium]